MSVVTRVIKRSTSRISKSGKPVVISWNKIPLLRSHSINACCNEIFESSRDMGFIKINLIGASGSGKTVLSGTLSHLLHTLDPTFEVHFFEDEDIINFKQTIQGLSKNNQILVFDDLSGLVTKYGKIALDRLEAEITTVRHINKNEDRKIIMMLNFHAQKKLSKFLRISDFTFYTDCKNEEVGYLEELLGKRRKPTIIKFKELRASSRMHHKFSFHLGRKDTFTYKDGKPFRVLLYNNSLTTRFVVSPQVEWILKGNICQVCNPTEQTKQSKMNLEEFVNDFSKRFGKGICKRAIELKLLRLGMNTQPPRVGQAEKYIDQYFNIRQINLKELASCYGLKETKTKLFPKKQPFQGLKT